MSSRIDIGYNKKYSNKSLVNGCFCWQNILYNIIFSYRKCSVVHQKVCTTSLATPQKEIWSITMPDMINTQKGNYLMNNRSIINIILFAVTIFQHSPLTIYLLIGHWMSTSTEQYHLGNIIN
jgi:hypothetical protein